jgi:diguanylate cyclase
VIGRLAALTTARSISREAAPGGDDAQRQLFRAIGAFLIEQRLAPTPANYTLVHTVLSYPRGSMARAVTLATDGNVRLSQAEADRIMAAPQQAADKQTADTVASVATSIAELAGAIDAARERFDCYAGIVDTSRQDAKAYGDALATEAATLVPAAAAGAQTVAALLALTESMIDKTRSAEEQLRAASVEMDDLRANLTAARQDADTDPLTGLPNRRAFGTSYKDCVNAVVARPVALALCDIDSFKRVNDVHGHEVGDRVIRLVGRELSQGCDGSVVARYGGEEFVILFDGRTVEDAMRILNRTREALHGRSFRVAGTIKTLEDISFSGGVVAVSPGEDCSDALRRADAALYRAKQGGRNRIEQGE